LHGNFIYIDALSVDRLVQYKANRPAEIDSRIWHHQVQTRHWPDISSILTRPAKSTILNAFGAARVVAPRGQPAVLFPVTGAVAHAIIVSSG
jgi:hypothetical protein